MLALDKNMSNGNKNIPKFQLYPPNGFWGDDFLIYFFFQADMATNQI